MFISALWLYAPRIAPNYDGPAVGEDVAIEHPNDATARRAWSRPQGGQWREITREIDDVARVTDSSGNERILVRGNKKLGGIPRAKLHGGYEQWKAVVQPSMESSDELIIGNVTEKAVD